MTAYWLAQGVGVIAFLIGITTFFNRDERRFKNVTNVASKSNFRSIAPLLAYIFFFWAPILPVPVPSLMPFVH